MAQVTPQKGFSARPWQLAKKNLECFRRLSLRLSISADFLRLRARGVKRPSRPQRRARHYGRHSRKSARLRVRARRTDGTQQLPRAHPASRRALGCLRDPSAHAAARLRPWRTAQKKSHLIRYGRVVRVGISIS
jgi:hypothetical protein